jgi:hypothetical protein
VTTELDRLELELRSVPGVVAVGFTEDGAAIAVHVVALSAVAPPNLQERLDRAVRLCAEPVELELRIELQ